MTRPRAGALLTLATVGAALLLADLAGRDVHDPAAMAWYPRCLIHALTGWHCPGCGATRAAHALLHGRVGDALSANALFVLLGLPLSAYAYVGAWRLVLGRPGVGTPSPRQTHLAWAGLAVMVLFGVARNLPGLGALAPS